MRCGDRRWLKFVKFMWNTPFVEVLEATSEKCFFVVEALHNHFDNQLCGSNGLWKRFIPWK